MQYNVIDVGIFLEVVWRIFFSVHSSNIAYLWKNPQSAWSNRKRNQIPGLPRRPSLSSNHLVVVDSCVKRNQRKLKASKNTLSLAALTRVITLQQICSARLYDAWDLQKVAQSMVSCLKKVILVDTLRLIQVVSWTTRSCIFYFRGSWDPVSRSRCSRSNVRSTSIDRSRRKELRQKIIQNPNMLLLTKNAYLRTMLAYSSLSFISTPVRFPPRPA